MIHKPRIEPTPEEIRARLDRSILRPFAAHIIDMDTHVHVNYLVFADSAYNAINLAREYGRHAPGSVGQATPIDTAFMYGSIPQVARLA